MFYLRALFRRVRVGRRRRPLRRRPGDVTHDLDRVLGVGVGILVVLVGVELEHSHGVAEVEV